MRPQIPARTILEIEYFGTERVLGANPSQYLSCITYADPHRVGGRSVRRSLLVIARAAACCYLSPTSANAAGPGDTARVALSMGTATAAGTPDKPDNRSTHPSAAYALWI